MADPELWIRGRGRGSRGGSSHPDPKIKRGGGLEKNFSRPFGPQFGLKIRGDPSLNPPLTYASTLIAFKPQYPHTNAPN